MFRQLDPREGPAFEPPTRSSIFVSYLMMATLPLFIWILSNPVIGFTVIASGVVLIVLSRRLKALKRCFSACGGFAFDIGETVRISISHQPSECTC